jgi:hypothetical protein
MLHCWRPCYSKHPAVARENAFAALLVVASIPDIVCDLSVIYVLLLLASLR